MLRFNQKVKLNINSKFARLLIILYVLFLSSQVFAQKQDTTKIATLINEWHQAAAVANAQAFFSFMSNDCIYIGTDATERWTKTEFVSFAKPYFDKGKAWDFKPYNRDIHVTSDKKIVWFSELLTTWMGTCRGSGVLKKIKGEWKLVQYHLSVTVPNDQINDFLKLINSQSKP